MNNRQIAITAVLALLLGACASNSASIGQRQTFADGGQVFLGYHKVPRFADWSYDKEAGWGNGSYSAGFGTTTDYPGEKRISLNGHHWVEGRCNELTWDLRLTVVGGENESPAWASFYGEKNLVLTNETGRSKSVPVRIGKNSATGRHTFFEDPDNSIFHFLTESNQVRLAVTESHPATKPDLLGIVSTKGVQEASPKAKEACIAYLSQNPESASRKRSTPDNIQVIDASGKTTRDYERGDLLQQTRDKYASEKYEGPAYMVPSRPGRQYASQNLAPVQIRAGGNTFLISNYRNHPIKIEMANTIPTFLQGGSNMPVTFHDTEGDLKCWLVNNASFRGTQCDALGQTLLRIHHHCVVSQGTINCS